MSFSELTLEKLIGEINGLRQKMHGLYEDYGRTAQDLQDRINVLGYTLNGHLKELRDQISSTPQRLLSLETKFVQGEVSEDDYRGQRDEFKNLLQRNLRNIEEVRSMLTVLSQLEVRPLNPSPPKPALIRQALTPIQTPEERGRDVFPRDILGQSSPIAPSPSWPTEGNSPISPSILNPNLNNVATVANPDPIREAPGSSESDLRTRSPSPLQTPTIVISPTFPENSPVLTPSPEEDQTQLDSLVDDQLDPAQLVVRVLPENGENVQEASVDSSVSDISRPQPEDSVDVTSERASDSSTLQIPPQFLHVSCPKCGSDVEKPAKMWELKGGKSKKNILIGLFHCQACMVKFREAITKEII